MKNHQNTNTTNNSHITNNYYVNGSLVINNAEKNVKEKQGFFPKILSSLAPWISIFKQDKQKWHTPLSHKTKTTN